MIFYTFPPKNVYIESIYTVYRFYIHKKDHSDASYAVINAFSGDVSGTCRSSSNILAAMPLSSLRIALSAFLVKSIRQAKAFLQLVERHGLKPAGPVILDLLQ